MDEEALVRKARQGDGESFGRLFETHSPRALGAAIAILGNRADAEDVVQEAAIKAFNSLGSLASDGAFGAWFTRIVVNKAIDLLRQRRRDQERTTPYDPDWDPPGASRDLEGELDVAGGVGQLPPEHQAVIRLYYGYGYSTPQIAELLGRPEGTVRRLLSESYRRLRLILREQDERSTPS
ncbi:MAG: RNA polymerase sigma factor [Chloroflexi bacterium]|nr:RNA polymerase sigma factor [Chloroflexota bacterium]